MKRQTATFEPASKVDLLSSRSISGRVLAKVFSLILISVFTVSSCTKTAERPQASVQTDAPAEFGQPLQSQNGDGQQTAQTEDGLVSQDEILAAQANQERKVELTFSARVNRLLRDDTKGLPHQQFLVELNNGTRVKIAHDIKYAPRVPIQEGDILTIKGEYIWNRKGGVVHWTHHSDTPRHEGGYIDFGGKRYE